MKDFLLIDLGKGTRQQRTQDREGQSVTFIQKALNKIIDGEFYPYTNELYNGGRSEVTFYAIDFSSQKSRDFNSLMKDIRDDAFDAGIPGEDIQEIEINRLNQVHIYSYTVTIIDRKNNETLRLTLQIHPDAENMQKFFKETKIMA